MIVIRERTLNIRIAFLIFVSGVKCASTEVIPFDSGVTARSFGSFSHTEVSPVSYELRTSKSSPLLKALQAGRSETDWGTESAQPLTELNPLPKSNGSGVREDAKLATLGLNFVVNKTEAVATKLPSGIKNISTENVANNARNSTEVLKNSDFPQNADFLAMKKAALNQENIKREEENATTLSKWSFHNPSPQRQNPTPNNQSYSTLEFHHASPLTDLGPFYTILNGQVIGSINLSPKKTTNLNGSSLFEISDSGKRESASSKEDDDSESEAGLAPAGPVPKDNVQHPSKTWMVPQLDSPSVERPTVMAPLEQPKDINNLSNGDSMAIINHFMDFLKVIQYRLNNLSSEPSTSQTITPDSSSFSLTTHLAGHRDAGPDEVHLPSIDEEKQIDSSSINPTLNHIKKEDNEKQDEKNIKDTETPLESLNGNNEEISKHDKIVLLTQALENDYEDDVGGRFSSESEGSADYDDESMDSRSEDDDYRDYDWPAYGENRDSYRNIDGERRNYKRNDNKEKQRFKPNESDDAKFEFNDEYFEPIRDQTPVRRNVGKPIRVREPVRRPVGKPKRESNRRKNIEKVRYGGGFSSLNCHCGHSSNTRIVGGEDSHISRHPWLTQLVVTLQGSPFCGGSLINDRHVLTAAHCLKGRKVEELYVKMGSTTSNQGEAFPVSSYIMHPMYNLTDVTKYDIALIRLMEPIQEFSTSISPVCLPTGGGRNRDLTKGIVAGFGRLTEEGPQSDKLQEARVIIMESSSCGVNSKYSENQLNPMVICAKGDKIDSCQGDSGGPLVRKIGDQHVQVGITSWGVGCAREGYPGIYTKVASFIPWLQEHTAEAAYCHRNVANNRLVAKPQDPQDPQGPQDTQGNEDLKIMREFVHYVAQKLQAKEE